MINRHVFGDFPKGFPIKADLAAKAFGELYTKRKRHTLLFHDFETYTQLFQVSMEKLVGKPWYLLIYIYQFNISPRALRRLWPSKLERCLFVVELFFSVLDYEKATNKRSCNFCPGFAHRSGYWKELTALDEAQRVHRVNANWGVFSAHLVGREWQRISCLVVANFRGPGATAVWLCHMSPLCVSGLKLGLCESICSSAGEWMSLVRGWIQKQWCWYILIA